MGCAFMMRSDSYILSSEAVALSRSNPKISSALKAMYLNEHINEMKDSFKDDIIIQAIENVAILLKEMYPRINDGLLPNLEDTLKMFSNFELVEKMSKIRAADEELKEKYSIQLEYFKNHFYI